jgi:hypothetical protein
MLSDREVSGWGWLSEPELGPKRYEKGPEGDAAPCVAPIGAAMLAVGFGHAGTRGSRFSSASEAKIRAAIAARGTVACRTHSFRLLSAPLTWLGDPNQSKPFGRRIWDRKMPQIHAGEIFLPPYFCHPVWENCHRAKRHDLRYPYGSAGSKVPTGNAFHGGATPPRSKRCRLVDE